MKRRDFIALLGGAATWPLAARAQQMPLPVIGWLGSGSRDTFGRQVAAFHQGIAETGFVEGKTVTVEYRWAEGQYDRLPALAAELVRRQVAVILSSGGIHLCSSEIRDIKYSDCISEWRRRSGRRRGLVAKLNHPGWNITGVNFLANNVATKKQLSLLHELVPTAKRVALINPESRGDFIVSDLEAAVHHLNLQLLVQTATTDREYRARLPPLQGGKGRCAHRSD